MVSHADALYSYSMNAISIVEISFRKLVRLGNVPVEPRETLRNPTFLNLFDR